MTSETNNSTPSEPLFDIGIESDAYGNFRATVPANANPLWHGSYAQAVLSLYLADITGTPTVPLGVLCFVISDKYNTALDLAGHVVYDANYQAKTVIENAMAVIGSTYAQHLMKVLDDGTNDGSISKH